MVPYRRADQIVIAHLSDLHFGAQGRIVHGPGRKPHQPQLCRSLPTAFEDILDALQLDDMDDLHVVVSGDLTSGGEHGEFRLAHNYLHKIEEQGDHTWFGLVLPKHGFGQSQAITTTGTGQSGLESPASTMKYIPLAISTRRRGFRLGTVPAGASGLNSTELIPPVASKPLGETEMLTEDYHRNI
jgi:hypothetical protein